MRAQTLLLAITLTAACASGNADISPAEERINAVAKEKTRKLRYPRLRPLPKAAEVVGAGFDEAAFGNLKEDGAALQSLRALLAGPSSDAAQVAATADALRALVEEARTQRLPARIIDLDALDLPEPPPLN